MKYMLFIYAGDDTEWDSLSEAEQQAIYREYGALSADPSVVSDHRLQPSGAVTTIRVDADRALTTDGPFVETKEELGGYYLIEVDDLDAALAFAARIPAARRGGAGEIRPIVEA